MTVKNVSEWKWRHGTRCVLQMGDCLKVLRAQKPRSIQCVITDPPYGATACAWDHKIDVVGWWAAINAIITETAVVACFAAEPFATDLINGNRRAFRYDLVWDKLHAVGFLNANRQPLRVHERLLFFCRRPSKSVYRPQFSAGTPYTAKGGGSGSQIYRGKMKSPVVNTGTRHPTSILRFAKPGKGERRHPTQKPLKLLNWLVRSYSRPGQIILDPFMGSGSLCEAALAAHRRCVGIERDPTIFRTAVEHLSNRVTRSQLLVISPSELAAKPRAPCTLGSALAGQNRRSEARANPE